MIDKQVSYAYYRPFYHVDSNVSIVAGMIAFLATDASGVTVATTAASGTVPIGTFWKDAASTYIRTTVESQSFSTTTGTINLRGGNITGTTKIKVTNSAGTTTYTQGTDYSISTANGVVTRIAAGAITAGQTVVIWYEYSVSSSQLQYEMSSTRWSTSQNYDRCRNDTLGSDRIAIAEGDAILYTDQYDVAQTYTLNCALRSDANSLWTSAGIAGGAISSVCGRCINVPTAANPFLGVAQVRVTA